jgi:hypothetical protein
VYSSDALINCDASRSRLANEGYNSRSAEFREVLVAYVAFRVGFTRNKLF